MLTVGLHVLRLVVSWGQVICSGQSILNTSVMAHFQDQYVIVMWEIVMWDQSVLSFSSATMMKSSHVLLFH